MKYGGTKSYLPFMSVLFVFTILFFDIQKILHLIFIQWNQPNDDSTSTLSDDDFEEDFANMPAKKLRWLHNHRKVSWQDQVQSGRSRVKAEGPSRRVLKSKSRLFLWTVHFHSCRRGQSSLSWLTVWLSTLGQKTVHYRRSKAPTTFPRLSSFIPLDRPP